MGSPGLGSTGADGGSGLRSGREASFFRYIVVVRPPPTPASSPAPRTINVTVLLTCEPWIDCAVESAVDAANDICEEVFCARADVASRTTITAVGSARTRRTLLRSDRGVSITPAAAADPSLPPSDQA